MEGKKFLSPRGMVLCGALLLLGGGVALGLRFYSGIARDPMRAFTEPSPSPSPLQAGQPLPSPTSKKGDIRPPIFADAWEGRTYGPAPPLGPWSSAPHLASFLKKT